jgi:hypothetical protein
LPEPFLAQIVGVGTPAKIHQGNPTISTHDISRRACLAGLEGTVLQTSEQRARCGHDNMVPVHLRGKDPYFCIDIFEFPNRPCELPFVWASPTYAKKLCELQGKRLCSQIEWQLACRADPNDGPDTVYAYGDTLDLDACHTKKRHRQVAEKPCTTTDAPTTYRTCPTDTEPSGSFPKCRSRYGVYDLHGNVAEIMMRRDGDGTVKSQLKGSAWFYDEVAREVSGPPLHPGSQGAYPDHCNFDPRVARGAHRERVARELPPRIPVLREHPVAGPLTPQDYVFCGFFADVFSRPSQRITRSSTFFGCGTPFHT